MFLTMKSWMPSTYAYVKKYIFLVAQRQMLGTSRAQPWFYRRNVICKYNNIGMLYDLALCFVFSFSDDFRVFCGDLGNEVTDEILTRTFSKYPSLLKAKVVRDKKTNKSKGYGFLSFKDPNDFVKAMREMNGKQCLCEVYVKDYIK